jgi:hypothetical protein
MYALQNCSVLFLFTVGLSWLTIPLFIFAFEKKRFSTPSCVKGKWPGRAILLASIVLSGIAIVIQYFRYPDLRGIDTMYYVNQLASAKDLAALVQLLPADPRIAYVLFLKCLTSVGASNDLSVKLGSLVLMGLNASAYYLLGKELVGDSFGGGLVALFSALGSQTAVSLYAGIYANWLSLSLAACAFAFYLRAVKSGRGVFYLAAGLFIVMCLLTHPWSGLIYSIVLAITCVLDTVTYRRGRWHFPLALASAVCIIILLGCLYAPYRVSLLTLSNSFQVSNMQKLTSNLEFTMNYMVGGFLSAPYIVFAFIGFWGLAVHKGSSTSLRLLSLWLAATFTPILFVEQWLQWRLVYLMPIQVLSGLGVYYLCCFMARISKERRLVLLTLIVCATLLTMFNYLLTSVRFIPSV